ncbi:Hypothetical predicted protein [Marmota monax]|uniref:Uncharacterized protein n=1 Tax=Marmota monax TaxID=9995 RepID=A0A5E4CWK2_MARMO|nr:hypothetical protein GHT09_018896 [Marmota monax]VTJ86224.1 Hypothetical predicted protein [Marmota monax]
MGRSACAGDAPSAGGQGCEPGGSAHQAGPGGFALTWSFSQMRRDTVLSSILPLSGRRRSGPWFPASAAAELGGVLPRAEVTSRDLTCRPQPLNKQVSEETDLCLSFKEERRQKNSLRALMVAAGVIDSRFCLSDAPGVL